MILIKEGSCNKGDSMFVAFPTPRYASGESKLTYFHLEKQAAEWIYRNDVTEKPLIFWAIDKFARPDKNVVDIGAHLGIYTWTFANHVNHVYSFECNPKTFCYLAANVALHGVTDKVTLHNCPLGNEEKDMEYIVRNEEGGENGFKVKNDGDSAKKRIPMRVRTLDSFGIQDIGLIKIDVEGFEKEVLEGSLETLKKNDYPPIIFESWADYRLKDVPHVQELRRELFSFVTSIGYQIQEMKGGYGEIFLAIKG
jgi:FkbM family methyltransferase